MNISKAKLEKFLEDLPEQVDTEEVLLPVSSIPSAGYVSGRTLANLLEKSPTVKDFTLSKIMGHASKTETEKTYLKPDLEEMYAALAQAQYNIDLDILREKSLWNKTGAPGSAVESKVIIRPASKKTTRRRKTAVPVMDKINSRE